MTTCPVIPPLARASSVLLHAAPTVGALSHVLDLLSAFLDASPHRSLVSAASCGSTRLLQRAASRITQDPQVTPSLLNGRFSNAIRIALEQNDLVMVQLIHELHPEPLRVNTLELAMQFGMLEMVQWVAAHRQDLQCSCVGVGDLCVGCVFKAMNNLGKQDAFRVVQWLTDAGVSLADDEEEEINTEKETAVDRAILLSADITRLCDEQGLLTEAVGQRLLEKAISGDLVAPSEDSDVEASIFTTASDVFVDAAAADYLIKKGFTCGDEDKLRKAFIRGSCRRGHEAVVEVVLASPLIKGLPEICEYSTFPPGTAKVLQWNRYAWPQSIGEEMETAAAELAHLDTIQWLYKDSYPAEDVPIVQPEQGELLRFYEWRKRTGLEIARREDMVLAAQFGYLEVIQWLHHHCEFGWTADVMDAAAANGHFHVVEWLYWNRSEDCSQAAFTMAAFNGHLRVLEWIWENLYDQYTPWTAVYAACQGQVEVLEWLSRNESVGCTACVTEAVLKGGTRNGSAVNALNGLRWLDEHPVAVPCTGRCIKDFGHFAATHPRSFEQHGKPVWLGTFAVCDGDLELLQYIVENHVDSWPTDDNVQIELFEALLGFMGHLPMLLWLHQRQVLAIDWGFVRECAASNRNSVWLDFILNHYSSWLRGELPAVKGVFSCRIMSKVVNSIQIS